MRKSKKLKVGKDDVRVGNFIYHREDDYIKVSDVSGMVSHRVSIYSVKGQQLQIALDGVDTDPRYRTWLEQYAVVLYNVLCCVFDVEFLSQINKSAVECAERHKKLYVKEVSDQEDARILDEVKETHEVMEKLANEPEE